MLLKLEELSRIGTFVDGLVREVWTMNSEHLRQKAERYLTYARRMKNQEAKTAVIDRAVECIRLAERTELDNLRCRQATASTALKD